MRNLLVSLMTLLAFPLVASAATIDVDSTVDTLVAGDGQCTLPGWLRARGVEHERPVRGCPGTADAHRRRGQLRCRAPAEHESGILTISEGVVSGSYGSWGVQFGPVNLTGGVLSAGRTVIRLSSIVGNLGPGIASPIAAAIDGGPTPTHALFADSPATDRMPSAACTWHHDGDPATPEVELTTDQRGGTRPREGNGAAPPAGCGFGPQLALRLPSLRWLCRRPGGGRCHA